MKTVAILICVGLFVSDSKAILEFSNPIRSVSASNNMGSSDTKSTSEFGHFNESANVEWIPEWGNYHAIATQDSIITSDGITLSGSVHGGSPFFFYGLQGLRQYSSSSFQVDFAINTPREITLTGGIIISVDVGGTNYDTPDGWVRLSGQGGDIFSQNLHWWWDHGSGYYQKQINEEFFLDTGLYTLSIYAATDGWYTRYGTGPGSGGEGMASYDIALTPEPATLLLLGLGLVFLKRR